MLFRKSVLLAISAAFSKAIASSCTEVDGNSYCDQTSAVLYSGVGFSGSYNDVTAMNEDTGVCSTSSKSFSGTLSPLDEELSVHFRGPLNLKQFAVYYPSSSGSSQKKRDVEEEDCTTTQHVHHVHKRAPATKIVEVTETIIVDQYGNTHTSQGVVTTTLPTTSAAAPVGVADEVTSDDDTTVADNDSSSPASTFVTSTYSAPSTYAVASSSSSSESSESSSSSSASGSWERTSYFTPGSTSNVTFLNTLGGSGSGVWSAELGNSLSYCAADGVSSASDATALNDVTIASDVEYIIFSGSSCDDDSEGCGYYREGIPAYHGFAGTEKIFLFEFEMPTATDSTTNNHDMPAIWLLNAKIPRTSQYGSSSCSCWSSGCGELDLFEILSAGSSMLISHLHDGQGDAGTAYGGGGSADYFTRPTSSSAYGAAVFINGDVYILMLDSLDFDTSLDASTIESWISGSVSSANLV